MILESSKDLLYIVIAFSILWLTIFTSWAIYYFAMILKQARDTVRDMRTAITLFEKLLSSIQSKVETSSTHLAFLVESVKQGMQFMNERNAKKTTRTAKRATKKTKKA